jgi:hypothetical protein
VSEIKEEAATNIYIYISFEIILSFEAENEEVPITHLAYDMHKQTTIHRTGEIILFCARPWLAPVKSQHHLQHPPAAAAAPHTR